MKKVAIFFVLTVLAPCAVLAWMTTRTMKEEQAAFERQRVAIAQQQTDAMAARVNDFMTVELRSLELQVEQLLREKPLEQAAAEFDSEMRRRWGRVEVGFALQSPQLLLSPAATDEKAARFREENGAFFGGQGAMLAYEAPFSSLLNVGKSAEPPPGGVALNRDQPDAPVVAQNGASRDGFPRELTEATLGARQLHLAKRDEADRLSAAQALDGGDHAPREDETMAQTAEKKQAPSEVPQTLAGTTVEKPVVARRSGPAKPGGGGLENGRAGLLDGAGKGDSTMSRAATQPPVAAPTPAAPAVAAVTGTFKTGKKPEPPQAAAADKTVERMKLNALTDDPKGLAAAPPAPALPPMGEVADAKTKSKPADAVSAPAPMAAAPVAKALKDAEGLAPVVAKEEVRLAELRHNPSPSPTGPAEDAGIAMREGISGAAEAQLRLEAPAAPASPVAARADSYAGGLWEVEKSRGLNRFAMEGPVHKDGATEWRGVADAAAATPNAGESFFAAPANEPAAAPMPAGGAAQAFGAESSPPVAEAKQSVDYAFRRVAPQHPSQRHQELAARLATSSAREIHLSDLWAGEKSGIVTRFSPDGEMRLLLWCRPASAADHLFGVEVALTKLAAALAEFIRADSADSEDLCFTLLNHHGQPVAKSLNGFDGTWARPYVSTEIGKALPHWEIAAYLLDPTEMSRAARAAGWKLGMLVLAVVATAVAGAFLIWQESRRRMEEARQKTDFVSSVSHELRTPLTSIRMFSDLLAEPSITPSSEKARKYAQVISEEAGRLTRLINSVLDFARLERGQPHLRLEKIDLRDVVADTLDHYRPHLESLGFALNYAAPPEPVLLSGDRDRLSQVLLNLLSNAEKYSGDGREIDVSLTSEAGGRSASLCVADRGPGVPRGKEKKIFEKFFRSHDSLASGIPGTGLGLALARQLIRAHRGDLRYERREGGGSCFCVTLPVLRTE